MEEEIKKYINTRLETRKEIIDLELVDKITKEVVGLFLSGILNISGLCVELLSPSIGIAMAILGAGVFCIKLKNVQKLEKRKERLEDEIVHLKFLKVYHDYSKAEKNEKVVQIRKAGELIKVAEEKYSKAKVYTFISYIVTTMGLVVTFINPVLGLIAFPAIIANALTCKNEVAKYRDIQDIKNAINNVNHDIGIIGIKDGITTKSTEFEIKEQNSKEKIAQAKEKNEDRYEKMRDIFNEVCYSDQDVNEKPKEYRKVK